MKKYAFAWVTMIAALLPACRPDDVPTPNGTKTRTLFIYMAAQNSLGDYGGRHYDYENIALLLSGVKAAHLQTNNILIYHDPMVAADGRADTRPRLLQVVMDAQGKATTREIEIFTEQNSVSAEVMKATINRVLDNAAFQAEHYSFLMWSHGTGWLPAPAARSRAIGQDGSDWMDIDDFAAAIPDGVFDCIVIDACYMATAECAYALRNDADYLIVSPTEIMGSGMPYDVMPDCLLGAEPKYNDLCDAFYDLYDDDYGSTISLIRPDGTEALADVVRNILAPVSLEDIYAIPSGDMQHFDRFGSTGYPDPILFDLGSFVRQIATQEQLQAFEQAMGQVVPYERHSNSFMLGYSGFHIREYSGLSVYVPRRISGLAPVDDYYQTLDWYRAVYR